MNEDDGLYERAALGAILLNPKALAEIAVWLEPEDFSWPVHRATYSAACWLRAHGDPVDYITVLAELQRQQYPDPERRLPLYVHEMVEAVPNPGSAAYYAKLVLGRSVRREVLAAGVELQQLAVEGLGTPGELLEQTSRVRDRFDEVSARWALADTPRIIRDEVGVLERDGELYGVADF